MLPSGLGNRQGNDGERQSTDQFVRWGHRLAPSVAEAGAPLVSGMVAPSVSEVHAPSGAKEVAPSASEED